MPRLKIIDEMSYKGFTAYLSESGFVRSGTQVELREIKKKGISTSLPPRSQNGRGDVWIYYTRNGYRVVVQTSLQVLPFKMLSNPAWVIIEDEKGNSVFYGPPLHRTKNFLDNLLLQSLILQKIAQERPLCRCGCNMNIVKGEFLREYLLSCCCENTRHHEYTPMIEVYEFIWSKLLNRLRTYLKYKLSKENYNKYIAEQSGKTFGQAILNRKRWLKSE